MKYDRIILTDTDKEFFDEKLKEFLPEEIFDVHVHTWTLEHFFEEPKFKQRGEDWADLIEQENPFEVLTNDYSRMFPGRTVHSLMFGWIGTKSNLDKNNAYVGEIAKKTPGSYGLAVTCPGWSIEETKRQIEEYGLYGMKPYITYVNESIATVDITIFDMLTREQFKLADENGYVVMIHLPRPGRMADPVNLSQLKEIDNMYPRAKIIVAHLGRCYSDEDMGNAFEELAETKNLKFDFSGNTNKNVIRKAIETFGTERVMFGSDLPLTHIHMRRIYENGHYVNLINGDERPQINNASYMRTMPDANQYTFYLYEVIEAFRQASIDLGLNRTQIENVMCNNAKRLFQ